MSSSLEQVQPSSPKYLHPEIRTPATRQSNPATANTTAGPAAGGEQRAPQALSGLSHLYPNENYLPLAKVTPFLGHGTVTASHRRQSEAGPYPTPGI